MTITIKIDTGNAAFGDNGTERDIELEHITISQVAPFLLGLSLEAPAHRTRILRDSNGNTVGWVKVTGQ